MISYSSCLKINNRSKDVCCAMAGFAKSNCELNVNLLCDIFLRESSHTCSTCTCVMLSVYVHVRLILFNCNLVNQ
jgi:hypothetical protein